MAETAQTVRDILLSVYLAGGILLTLALLLLAFLLYRGVRSLLKSSTRVADNVSELSDLAVENLVTPLRQGASFSNAVGSTFGFVSGFISGLRGGRDKKREQEQEQAEHRGRDRDRRRRRRGR